jgi:hypothetical protein
MFCRRLPQAHGHLEAGILTHHEPGEFRQYSLATEGKPCADLLQEPVLKMRSEKIDYSKFPLLRILP